MTAALSLNAAVDQASRLLATDAASAQRLAEAVLKAAPKDPRAILILASARRRQGDPAAARALLEPLAKAWPRAAHTQYELGATLAALGQTAPAIIALRNAVALKPDLAEAWRALGEQLFVTGDAKAAERAFAEHERALITDPALKGAADALFDGRLDAAEQQLRARLTAAPNDATALRMLAEVIMRLGRDGEAEGLLALCLKTNPSFDGARFSYATVLFRRNKPAEAMVLVEQLAAQAPDDPAYRNLLAACLAATSQYDRAIMLYEGLLAQFDKQAKIWLNYGHALRTTGRGEDTVAAYRRAIALAPELGEAYWSLANLKTVKFSDAELTAIAAQLGRADISAEDRLHLHYALGKALEDRKSYEPSFAHYAAGAKLRRGDYPYDADIAHAHMRASKALFTRDFFTARADGGSASPAPIFILGLPRAGSTLIEQILASHSAVEGTHELPEIGFIASELTLSAVTTLPAEQRPALGEDHGGLIQLTLNALANLTPAQRTALGEDYLARTRKYRKLGRPFFIDKMPNNCHHVGMIHLILPNAKIIDARRHPMGSCFSAFKQHFASGQGFSYDLTDLGRYYSDYVELMAHVDAVLPGRVHRVIYEDMVQDTEGEIRRLLDYCGLPFEAGCLKFHENDRAVRTVSSEQVRQPIFRDGLDRWRHYEPWLEPLKTALGPALETWRGD